MTLNMLLYTVPVKIGLTFSFKGMESVFKLSASTVYTLYVMSSNHTFISAMVIHTSVTLCATMCKMSHGNWKILEVIFV